MKIKLSALIFRKHKKIKIASYIQNFNKKWSCRRRKSLVMLNGLGVGREVENTEIKVLEVRYSAKAGPVTIKYVMDIA